MKKKKAQSLNARINKIRLIGLDIDGVLTDGGLYYFENGSQAKKFNVRDGMAIEAFRQAGYEIAILTGEKTSIVTHRAKKLGISHVYIGINNKLPTMQKLASKLQLSLSEIAYIGDEINDLEMMQNIGLAITVTDAYPAVKKISHYICQTKGGEGVLREVYSLFEHTLLPKMK